MSGSLTFKEIGNRLRKARKASGFTQEDVANLIGLSRVKLSNIENGKAKIDSLALKELSNLYGYSITYFLESPEEYKDISFAFRSEKIDETNTEIVNWAKKIILNYKDLKEIAEE